MIRNFLLFFMPIYAILFLSGCTANLSDPEIDFEPPAYVEEMPSKEDNKDFTSVGSVFGQGENPLFSDHKAMHVNDIVTVIISENTQSSNSGSKQISESDSLNLGGGAFTSAGTNSAVNSAVSKLNGIANLGFGSTSDSAYKGQGSATKDASFTTTVSARIVKVLQNGNYFISGKREILVDNQKQIIQIGGVIRPYDIDQGNRINSSQMSEAKILYKTQGDVERATDRGWGTKIIQSVWPF
ncbi:Flagellar L-ring protein [Sulfurimonas denitrificans DSM 1251]|jgi:flagellar L-ring protein precursor FlgH|uniref:Flagellar L-ring protein n=1 Tax=Sulfurimonas denitrificans (strain ATCC 33889 / DSM 1251) TaxID=326298 RepID=FLGH_SULDN|nr:flagellar basal body L-ring protein FlgH [Sulfurimonas denitrificans]Q30SL9.1 RecName: Full=Flagellar L-ring protein; AltName: Full=Basal body L-ring protein; Flags: Precursor [Sulfurimonas denitrificans DSM 1251]ABB44012.1 Flagellar L-ring protein [Sulfurimonas denitrificans DSM 1251]MDD3443142.1 flagellar basal body L-ring protein FlgH [Sulfurimonas denitrificans]